jgi:hypothetical protein
VELSGRVYLTAAVIHGEEYVEYGINYWNAE